jgi:hypothetical protein
MGLIRERYNLVSVCSLTETDQRLSKSINELVRECNPLKSRYPIPESELELDAKPSVPISSFDAVGDEEGLLKS